MPLYGLMIAYVLTVQYSAKPPNESRAMLRDCRFQNPSDLLLFTFPAFVCSGAPQHQPSLRQ